MQGFLPRDVPRRTLSLSREERSEATRLALGIGTEVAQTAVRFSFDSSVTAADLEAAAAAVTAAVGSVRNLGLIPG